MIRFFQLCIRELIKYILAFVEIFSGQWITYILRPRRSVDFGHMPDPHIGKPDFHVAIVMQGPIMTKWDFTLETIKMYKMMYPDTDLIVSTWIDTKKSLVDKLIGLGVHVVLNRYPDNPGISHINYQIVSTREGIKKAQELGATYCLKTRTDQRMYRHDALEYLFAIVRIFPLANDITLKGRLVTLSMNTFKYRPYSLSDMFLFGFTEDVKKYWNIPLDSRSSFNMDDTRIGYSKAKVCEVYLCTHFVEKYGNDIKWSLKDSWGIYQKYFCILDTQMVDLYWPKYNRFLAKKWLNYSARMVYEEYQFSDWMRGYIGLSSTKYPSEKIIHLTGNCSINDLIQGQ